MNNNQYGGPEGIAIDSFDGQANGSGCPASCNAQEPSIRLGIRHSSLQRARKDSAALWQAWPEGGHCLAWTGLQGWGARRGEAYCGCQRSQAVKEVSFVQVLFRNLARLAAVSGVVALLAWLTWVMLDVSHMQSGFTLPY